MTTDPGTAPAPGPALLGLHALVTGGSRGIGAAIARMLDAEGARVSVIGRRAEGATALAATLTEAAGHGCDMRDARAVQATFARARQGFGPIRVLVNCAGAARSALIERSDDALWHDMLAVNLTGTFLACREAIADMRGAGHGRIINIASTAGLRGYAYAGAYAAAKHGVIGLTRSLALELARTGITVNAVCPGFTDTELLADSVERIVERTGRSREQARAALQASNPQGRLVQPAEVADAVRWLCGAGSAAITGQSIAVAGGEVT